MSFFSFFAFANASGPHGYQSTGLWACWSRYGLLSFASRFGFPFSFALSFVLAFRLLAAASCNRGHTRRGAQRREAWRDSARSERTTAERCPDTRVTFTASFGVQLVFRKDDVASPGRFAITRREEGCSSTAIGERYAPRSGTSPPVVLPRTGRRCREPSTPGQEVNAEGQNAGPRGNSRPVRSFSQFLRYNQPLPAPASPGDPP